MKQYTLTIICIILCIVLMGCANGDKENPLNGKNTDERMIMALEKAYPEHKFEIVKKYDEYNGLYYGMFQDENGVKFKVDSIIYDNHYHFGCYDEYLVELLKREHFFEKASEIVEQYGYTIEYDEDNKTVAILIPYSEDLSATDIAVIMKEVLNSVDVPEMYISDEEFRTGEVNYYTHSKMRTIGYEFTFQNMGRMSGNGIAFVDREKSVNELSVGIQETLNDAKSNIEAVSK